MAVELKVPSVGESITEVQIGDWLVESGAAVHADDPLVVIETDKVTVEMPAPAEGVITKQIKKKGDKAAVGEVIGYLEPRSAANDSAGGPKKSDGAEPPKKTAESKSDAKPSSPAPQARAKPAKRDESAAPQAPPTKERIVMPAAARELAQREISAEDVRATGPGGRVLKEDVQRHAAAPPPAPATPEPTRAPARSSSSREEQVIPMTPMRKRIAERLVQAQRTAAILTTFNEIDMGNVMALRKQHQERFQEMHQIKLGFMSFFVKASIEALKEFPQVNAEVRDDAIVYKNYYDIGIAVGGGKGLVVPILRNAERMSFAEIELAIADLGARAQANKLALDELVGGTFTISNGGIYGSLLSTPILNPPQSGILGLHAIQERAVVRDGQIVARPMMYVALSYDHRVIDGREAVTCLKRIKECMEDPARMLLEV